MSRKTTAAVLATFGVVFVLLQMNSYREKSATFDEPIHLTAGYAALAYGDYRVDPSHPPFMRMWAALPLLAMPEVALDVAVIDRTPPQDWLQQSFGFAHRFIYLDNDADRMLYAARFMVVVWGVVLGILVFCWAREWLGFLPAVFVLAFYTLSPNLAAHSSLVTTDFGETCFLFGSVYFLWRTCRRVTPVNVAGVALFSSLAVVTKFSGLMVGPIAACLLAVAVRLQPSIPARRAAAIGALVAASSFLAIWAVYGFHFAPGEPDDWLFNLDQAALVRQRVGGAAALAGWLDRYHVLPNAFTQGVLFSETSARMLPAFLAGSISTEGWWYYFPVAFLIKTPVAFLVVAVTGLLVFVTRRARLGLTTEAFVVLPVAMFLTVAMTSGINIGLRHILPIYPFVLLLAGAGAQELLMRGQSARIALGVLTLLWLTPFALVYPNTLTFFNQFVGGSPNGSHYLADSNIDWGQHLKGLKGWMDRNAVPHINLAYFGSADPAYYGITCTHLPGAPLFAEHAIAKPRLPGYVALSATVLSGVYLPPRWRLFYDGFHDLTPAAVIGNSIRVYWVDRWPEPRRPVRDTADIEVVGRLADSLAGQRWYDHAAVHYRQYLRRRPDNALVLGKLGVALMAAGRPQEGLDAFRQAVRVNPDGLAARRNLTIALLGTGRVDEAVEHAREAIELSPRDPAARELLREALRRQRQARPEL